MAVFGSGLIIIYKSWWELKEFIFIKRLTLQYDELVDYYQVFAIDGQVVYLATIFKSKIPLVSDLTQEDNDVSKLDFEKNYKEKANLSSYSVDRDRNKIVELNYRQVDIASDRYFLLIDLNNKHGKYKHLYENSGAGIKLAGIESLLLKQEATGGWTVRFGVVAEINENYACICWFRPGTMSIRDASNFQIWGNVQIFPLMADLTIENNNQKYCLNNFKETVTDITSNSFLEDAGGNMVQPEVGDLVVKALKFNTGKLSFHYHIWYLVE